MYPEDRVLIGVVNRRKDFACARDEHWYRIPQARHPRTINAEYVGLFMSGAFGKHNGGIRYYAERRGLELATRAQLLPDEASHPRADEVYYKIALGDLIEKQPPILNTPPRTITFIYTTWDRFVSAETVSDLYSANDYFVDRIYHALRDSGLNPLRQWDAEQRDTGQPANVRILCEGGTVTVSPEAGPGLLLLDRARGEDAILAEIRAAIATHGGPVTVPIPLDGS